MQDAIILYENGKAIGGEGHPTDADDITFDNSNTDLVSENVEGAIKEVNAKFDRGSVSVTSDGTKTLGQMLDALYSLIDNSKLSKDTVIVYDTAIYRASIVQDTQIILSRTFGAGSDLYIGTYIVKSSGSSSINWTVRTSGNSMATDTTTVQQSGPKMTLYY